RGTSARGPRAASAGGRGARGGRAHRPRRPRRGSSPRAILSRRAVSDADIDSEFEGHDPLEGEPPPPAAQPVVVPRWVQLVMLPISILALWVVARAAGPVLLIFIAAAIVALILNPLVTVFQRGLRYRGLAVATVYIGFLGFLRLAGYLAANPVADQARSFQPDVPGTIDD